ncbi:patatin-like serine [Colletotrichum chrysophilum]|uniref:Patatin-like serine n=1 Tax=Colletotrichum chrysophilum TaxID=1836956 RepID=A0AAD9A592_9PEZI|nr:patatin-like serine [Colletotrichum chrysophilum]
MTERPLLYADITVEEDSLDVPASNSIGDQLRHAVDTHCLAPVSAYAGVLGILTDVICVFLPDAAALDMVARVVASWSPNQHEASCPLPRLVLIVKTSPGQNQAKVCSQLLDTIRRKTAAKMLEARFSAVGVYALPIGVDVSAEYQYGRLRDHMKSESDIVRRHRIANSLLFNSRHFATLAESAYTSYVNGQPFDVVRATRARNQVPRKMQHSIERFIRKFAKEEAALATFVLPHIASAMMLDAFPPGMHKFAPEQVYRSLYKTVFVGALGALGMPKKYEAILRSIITRRPRRAWTDAGRVEGQQKFMRAYARRWRDIYSDRDCLVCLCRTPEYALSCGHAVCAIDARRFGEKTGPDSFVINACPLCFRSVGTSQYRVKPKTKGINILSIDGGGVRGIIPLQILQLLEKRLSSFLPDFPVQNHFDLIVGTSSGGLIALGAVMKDFSVSCCMNMLRNMSASVFRPRLPLPGWLQGRALRLLTIYLFGSLYPSESIDTFLRNALGDKKLLDHCAATARGAKVAVTASGVPRGGYLLSNYNGAGSDEHRGTCQHIRATGPPDRASVYDAARATTAAPGVFWPHSVPRVGKLQDGAICGENCPKWTALCESRSLWPGARRGVTLSLGTGYTDARPTSPVSPTTAQAPKRAVRPSGVFDTLRGYVSSLLHAVDSFMDGEAAYDRYTLEDGPALMDGKKTFRCNLKLDDPLPTLDDLDAIEDLRSQTSAAFQGGEQIDAVTRALLSTLFYFELTARPMRNRSGTTCVGRIVCNLDPGTDLHHLIMSLAGGGAEFFVQGVVVPLQRKSVNYRNTRFQQSIQLSVRDLDAEFPIALRVSGLGCEWEPTSISSSPFTLRGLLDSQGWNNHFGNADDTPTSPTRSRKRFLNVEGKRIGKKQRL